MKRVSIFLFLIMVFLSNPSFSNELKMTSSGLILGCKKNKLYVRGIFPNSPAKRAGIQLNEEIAQVKFGSGEFTEIISRNLQNNAASIQTGKEPFSIKTTRGAVYNIKPEDIIINRSNIPSSQSKMGRISKVSGSIVECTLTSRDKINHGDELIIFKGNRIIDTASVTSVETSGSRVRPHTLKRDDYANLQGASAVLYKTSPSAFRPVYNPDERDPRFTKINPEVYEYEQKTKKKDSDLKVLHFATIRDINPNTKTFVCYVIHGRKRPVGSEGDYLISEVTYDSKNMVTYHVGFSKAKLLYSRDIRDVSKDPTPLLKNGNKVQIFFRKRPGTTDQYDAELIVFRPDLSPEEDK